jgi:UTP--glucose-1-phosphate uridylyltransferase
MSSIAEQLEALPESTKVLLRKHRFDAQRFQRLAAKVRSGAALGNRETRSVRPPKSGDIGELPEPGSAERERLRALGLEELRQRRVALAVMAGGMATRMGGVVKALVEALPGKTFLELRLAEMAALEREVGVAPPLWLMTSHATDDPIRNALGDRIDDDLVGAFTQYLSLRLTPQGDVFRDNQDRPSEHAPGHGDLPDALRESSLIGRFVEGGGKIVVVANLDNLGATLDPLILGWHLDAGAAVTCEVVDKVGSDRGGIPVRVEDRPVVLEEFRLPEAFDPATVGVFNTNTFHFAARALYELEMDFTYFVVRKTVDDQPVIQFERLINEVTSLLPTRFLRVPREGRSSRFLPVKDHDELAQRRGDIEDVARDRKMIE